MVHERNGHTKTSAELRLEIARARQQIATSAAALRHEVAMTTDWREWVRRRPLLCVGGAFALGLAISLRRSSTRED
jgi:hypothetical protein